MNTKKAIGLLVLLIFAIAVINSCGGGGGGGGGNNNGGGGATTTSVSGKVVISSTVAGKPTVAIGKALRKTLAAANINMAAAGMPGATVSLYAADNPEYLFPVAEVFTSNIAGTYGEYTLDKLTYADENGNTYANGDPIPSGNYTIVVTKNDTTTLPPKFYVKVQTAVKRFAGFVTGNDIEVMDSAATPVPEIVSMFGLEQNTSGAYDFGGPATELPRNATIQIVFNVPMNRLIVHPSVSAITISDANGSISGTWKMSPDLLTATFYPDAEFAIGSLYTVNIAKNAESVYKKQLSSAYTGQFKAIDRVTVEPDVSRFRPVSQINAPVITPIQIQSTQRLDTNFMAVTSTPFIGDKPLVTYVGQIGSAGYPFVYDISHTPLQLATNYKITISGAKSITQTAMQPVSINFATENLSTGITGTTEPAIAEQVAIKDLLGKWLNALESRKSSLLTQYLSGDFYYLLDSVNAYDLNRDRRLSLSEFTSQLDDQIAALHTCFSSQTGTKGSVTGDVVDAPGDATDGILILTPTTARMKAAISVSPDPGSCSPTSASTQTLYLEVQKIDNQWMISRVSDATQAGAYPSSLSGILLIDPMDKTIYDEPQPSSPLLPAFQWQAVTGVTTYAVVLLDSGSQNLEAGWVGIVSQGTATGGDTKTMTFTGVSGGNTTDGPYVMAQGSSFGFQKPITKLKSGRTYRWAVLGFKTLTVADFVGGVTDPSTDLGASSDPNAFSTRNNLAPFVVDPTIPANLISGVSTTAPISAVFSEDIIASTLTGTTFTLMDNLGTTVSSVTVTYNETTNTASLILGTPLSYNVTYIANITSDIKDLAGIPMTSAKTWMFTTGSSPDSTAPVTSATPTGGLRGATSVTLASVDASPVTIYYTLDGSDPTTSSPVYSAPISMPSNSALANVTTTLKFRGQDSFGNLENVKTEIYTIDTRPPTVTATPPTGTYGSVTMTLGADEPATIWVTTDGTDPRSSGTRFQYIGQVGVISTTTVKFCGVDTVGNVSGVTSVVYTIDSTILQTTANPTAGRYGADQSVALTASIAGSTIFYGIDSAPTITYTVPVTVSGAAGTTTTKTLTFYAVNTGQTKTEAPQNSKVYIIDKQAPTGSISINSGAAYATSTSVSLGLSATDPSSGTVSQMCISNDTTVCSAWEAYSPTKSWTLASTNGTRTVYVQFRDALGNTSAAGAYSDTITLDTVAPSKSSSTPASGATDVSVTSAVTVNFSEAMDTATVTAGSAFRVMIGTTDITGTKSCSTSQICTFTPTANLGFSTTYTVTLKGPKDLAGNVIPITTWTFTTQYGKWDDTNSKWDTATWAP